MIPTWQLILSVVGLVIYCGLMCWLVMWFFDNWRK